MAQHDSDHDHTVQPPDVDTPETLHLPETPSPDLREFVADITSILPVALWFGWLAFCCTTVVSGGLLLLLRSGQLTFTAPVPTQAYSMGIFIGGVVYCTVLYHGAVEGDATLRDKYGWS